MYAVVKIGGRQYRVSPQQTLKVDRLKANPGEEVVISDVMLISEGDNIEVGTPTLPYRVTMEAVAHNRYPKVLSYHFKRRGGRRRLHGHRQPYTVVSVKAIEKEAQ